MTSYQYNFAWVLLLVYIRVLYYIIYISTMAKLTRLALN